MEINEIKKLLSNIISTIETDLQTEEERANKYAEVINITGLFEG